MFGFDSTIAKITSSAHWISADSKNKFWLITYGEPVEVQQQNSSYKSIFIHSDLAIDALSVISHKNRVLILTRICTLAHITGHQVLYKQNNTQSYLDLTQGINITIYFVHMGKKWGEQI